MRKPVPKAKMKPHNSTSNQGSSPSKNKKSSTELSDKQVVRLRNVLREQVEVHGRGNFPTLKISLHSLIVCVRRHLRLLGVPPKATKLNGGAASFILSSTDLVFSDLDLIFPIDLGPVDAFERVRKAVFDSLVELLPDDTNKDKINGDTMKDIYIRKMIKVNVTDRWSLFSLHNDYGRCIELKFVDRMRRQFEFSVDSFQITLDSLLDNDDDKSTVVKAESVFGNIDEALYHLNERLIDTRCPEEIRGGGLFKYCHLLTKGYRVARMHKFRQLERYMCSRFFIDFADVFTQEAKLRAYLGNHLGENDRLKYEYLLLLYQVVSESTVCLMSHERKQTLDMIDRLAHQLSLDMHYSQSCSDGQCGHTPRQTLLYLPKNAPYWILVV